jgi:hypothetical protein
MTEPVSACQHLSSGTNLRECEDQSWFKVQAVPCFVLIDVRCFRVPSGVRVRQVDDHCAVCGVLDLHNEVFVLIRCNGS